MPSLGRTESLVSEAGCLEHSLRPRVPQPVGILGGRVVMGRRPVGLSGELRSRASAFLTVPHR